MSEIKVMMVGASRSGKTSILASMMEFCSLNLAPYNLELAGADNNATFQTDIDNMKLLCNGDNSDNGDSSSRMSSLRGTTDPVTYSFELSYLHAGNGVGKNKIIIYDVPGETFDTQDAARMSDIVDKVKECQIIIVAIDTPAMLWINQDREGGIYEGKICCTNAVHRLATHLGENLDGERPDNNKCLKSIIFVPIKCEHLLQNENTRGRFRELIKMKIEKYYRNTLEYAQEGRFKVSIVPVETIGGVLFDHYSDIKKMRVLYFKPNKDFSGCGENKLYEESNSEIADDGTFVTQMVTRCELTGNNTVKTARAGQQYALLEGDELKLTSDMPDYPYVYAKQAPIPYIWYKPNGRYNPKNCEIVLFEIVKITIQQFAADTGRNINDILNYERSFWEIVWDIIRGALGGSPIANKEQLQLLCGALKKMADNRVFDNAIILQNRIDNDGSSLKINQ